MLERRIVARREFVPSRDPPRPTVKNFVQSPGGTWHEVAAIDPTSIYLYPDAVHQCALIKGYGSVVGTVEEQLQDGRDDTEEDDDAMVH